MNIRFLETVILLAELKSFRITAERMNMTPAAISNRIAAIEDELGIKLFERDARDVRLTEDGAAFVDGARDVVTRYGQLVNSISPPTAFEGKVRIGIVPSMAITMLPGIMDVLKEKFSRVGVVVVTAGAQELIKRLEDREVDVVLGLTAADSQLHHAVYLCTLGMFWIADKRVGTDQILGKSDLILHPIISYAAGMHNHDRILEYFADTSLEETVIHYSNSLGTTIAMVSAGVGISVLPPVVIQNELRAGTLQVLRVQPTFPGTDYYAIHMKAPTSRLAPLVASVARQVAISFCKLYDDALASC